MLQGVGLHKHHYHFRIGKTNQQFAKQC
jgi:hypothetical protein